jgi:hypothetical protein
VLLQFWKTLTRKKCSKHVLRKLVCDSSPEVMPSIFFSRHRTRLKNFSNLENFMQRLFTVKHHHGQKIQYTVECRKGPQKTNTTNISRCHIQTEISYSRCERRKMHQWSDSNLQGYPSWYNLIYSNNSIYVDPNKQETEEQMTCYIGESFNNSVEW